MNITSIKCLLCEIKIIQNGGVDMVLDIKTIKRILSMTERGKEVKVSTNYNLSDDYSCPHCDATVLDNIGSDGYIGDIILDKEYHTIESVVHYLNMKDSGYSWITDKMCMKCNNPYSIINGC